jgi:exo-1,4-beta-D-glucosaminidase
MPGWSCQWEWEEYLGKEVDDFGGVKTPEDLEIVARSLRDQVVWLRNHPSIFVWVLASDKLPRPDLERRYGDEMATVDPTRPLLASCGTLKSEVSGPTGVKMNGPYDWVPPAYWYVDKTRGGAYGFNTETGPGPQPPPVESLRRMLGEDHLWPIDEVWEYHCGRHEFGTLDRYEKALDARYGPAGGVEEFAKKSQLASYEAMRAMFEAFAVRRPETTGLVLWMFNSAWPEMFWQLYDYYLLPNGAFYGAKAATPPAGLVYDYGDDAVWAVAEPGLDVGGWTAAVRVLDLESREVFTREVELPAGLEYSARLLDVGEARRSAPVTFLDLRLRRPDGAVAARNFYWLSAAEDELDEAASTWFYTPAAAFADFKPLAELPPASLTASAELAVDGADGRLAVDITNPGESLAFFVELAVVDRWSGRSFVPVFFDDNYVSLLPGEERRLAVRFPLEGAAAADVTLRYSGWNVAAGEVPIAGGGG